MPRNLEKTESAEAGKTFDQDQGECRDGETTQENTKHTFQLEIDCETRESRSSSHRLLPIPQLNSCGPRRCYPIRETSLDRASEKLESGLCGLTADLIEEFGESLERTENGKGSPDHSGCFEVMATGMSGKVGEIVVCDVLGHEFPGVMAVLFDCYRSESGGCNVFDQVQADRWLVRDVKSVLLESLPPLRYESVQTAFVPKTHADAGLFLLLQQNYRENGREKFWWCNRT